MNNDDIFKLVASVAPTIHHQFNVIRPNIKVDYKVESVPSDVFYSDFDDIRIKDRFPYKPIVEEIQLENDDDKLDAELDENEKEILKDLLDDVEIEYSKQLDDDLLVVKQFLKEQSKNASNINNVEQKNKPKMQTPKSIEKIKEFHLDESSDMKLNLVVEKKQEIRKNVIRVLEELSDSDMDDFHALELFRYIDNETELDLLTRLSLKLNLKSESNCVLLLKLFQLNQQKFYSMFKDHFDCIVVESFELFRLYLQELGKVFKILRNDFQLFYKVSFFLFNTSIEFKSDSDIPFLIVEVLVNISMSLLNDDEMEALKYIKFIIMESNLSYQSISSYIIKAISSSNHVIQQIFDLVIREDDLIVSLFDGMNDLFNNNTLNDSCNKLATSLSIALYKELLGDSKVGIDLFLKLLENDLLFHSVKPDDFTKVLLGKLQSINQNHLKGNDGIKIIKIITHFKNAKRITDQTLLVSYENIILKLLLNQEISLTLIDCLVDTLIASGNYKEILVSYFSFLMKDLESHASIKKRIIKFFLSSMKEDSNELLIILLNTLHIHVQYCEIMQTDCSSIIDLIVKGLDSLLWDRNMYTMIFNILDYREILEIYLNKSEKFKVIEFSEYLLNSVGLSNENSYFLLILVNRHNFNVDLEIFVLDYLKHMQKYEFNYGLNIIGSFTILMKRKLQQSPSTEEILSMATKLVLNSTNPQLLDSLLEFICIYKVDVAKRLMFIGVKYIQENENDNFTALSKSFYIVGRILFYCSESAKLDLDTLENLIHISCRTSIESNPLVLNFLCSIYSKFGTVGLKDDHRSSIEHYISEKALKGNLKQDILLFLNNMFTSSNGIVQDLSLFNSLFHGIFKEVMKICLTDPSAIVHRLSFDFIFNLLKEGLVHPLECVTFLIVLESGIFLHENQAQQVKFSYINVIRKSKIMHKHLCSKFKDFIHVNNFNGLIAIYSRYNLNKSLEKLHLNTENLFESTFDITTIFSNSKNAAVYKQREFITEIFNHFNIGSEEIEFKKLFFILWNVLSMDLVSLKVCNFVVYLLLYNLDLKISELSQQEHMDPLVAIKLILCFKVRIFFYKRFNINDGKFFSFRPDYSLGHSPDYSTLSSSTGYDDKKTVIEELENAWAKYQVFKLGEDSEYAKALIEDAKSIVEEFEALMSVNKNETDLKPTKVKKYKRRSEGSYMKKTKAESFGSAEKRALPERSRKVANYQESSDDEFQT